MPYKQSSFIWDFYPWLRYLDSNQRMQGSKPCALPLGYTPLKSIASHPFYGSQTAIRNRYGGQTAVGIVVSQPLTAACDLGLQAVVS